MRQEEKGGAEEGKQGGQASEAEEARGRGEREEGRGEGANRATPNLGGTGKPKDRPRQDPRWGKTTASLSSSVLCSGYFGCLTTRPPDGEKKTLQLAIDRETERLLLRPAPWLGTPSIFTEMGQPRG